MGAAPRGLVVQSCPLKRRVHACLWRTHHCAANYIYAYGDSILPHESMLYFILALVGIGVVCTLMLVNPGASLLMVVSVGLVIVFLFGELWALGIRFNQVRGLRCVWNEGCRKAQTNAPRSPTSVLFCTHPRRRSPSST